MFKGSIEEQSYIDSMKAMKRMVRFLHETYNGEIFQAGIKKYKRDKILRSGVKGMMQSGKVFINNRVNRKKLQQRIEPFMKQDAELTEPNYFTSERVAVYTCVFGWYDQVQEPMCHPNNIDYYIITDGEISSDTTWKKVDLTSYEKTLEDLSNVEKNRWFKMHPNKVFPDYRYSVYIDGNVKPITDFTEFINRISKCGVAMHWHSYNNCVYQEALYNKYSVKKIHTDELMKHISYLREQGMPQDYGMSTCNVIARDHHNSICIKLMADWWSEFMNHCRRDQISFPYVAWNNGIEMSDIATLGNDVWESDVLLVENHQV